MRSLLQSKTKSTAGDHDRDNPTGRVQRQGVGEDKEYVAHKMASTGTYPSTYKNTVKEGGLSPPSSCEGGATAPLAPPPHSYPLLVPLFSDVHAHSLNACLCAETQ